MLFQTHTGNGEQPHPSTSTCLPHTCLSFVFLKTPMPVILLAFPSFILFVRPHLEYAIQFWSPNYIKDQKWLERIQRRATKLIPTLRNLSYEERLKQLDMFSLHKRRIRGDMIEVFKILNKLTAEVKSSLN